MGYVGLRRGSGDIESSGESPRSLRKGIIVNVLNPHPYIFWFSVGGPITIRATEANVSIAVAFVALFYVLLVGSKLIVALITARSRRFLKGRLYDLAIRTLGALLCLFALVLIRDGVAMIGSNPF
jgi:threonine/homoserine/homoserine lactone efflux protein